MTMMIYYKLVRYVHEMGKHVTTANTLLRAQRELKMVRRTSYIAYNFNHNVFAIYNIYFNVIFQSCTKISFSNCLYIR
jgi:hypothetical protein